MNRLEAGPEPASIPRMRRLRGLAWLTALLFVAAIATSGAHVHRAGSLAHHDDTGCVACTLAHAPIVESDAAPVAHAPAPTHEARIESPVLAPIAPSCAIPSSRAPPLG